MADLKKLVLLCALTTLALGSSFAQTNKRSLGAVTSTASVQNDVSPAVSDLPAISGAPSEDINGEGLEGPENPQKGAPTYTGGDTAGIQLSNLPVAAPTVAGNFPGLSVNAAGAGFFAPPDTNGAVGNGQYVQSVNVAFAVFNKTTGATIAGPFLMKSLWAGFGGDCETHNNGDPVVQYDKIANRWIISQFSIDQTTPKFFQCIAVSTTPNAAGTYFRYAFNMGTDFPDYPKLGTWPDAYYATFNAFNAAGTAYNGAKLCAFDRSKMLIGAAATGICFADDDFFYSVLPADFDGTVLPPAGSTEIFLEQDSNFDPSALLHLFNVHVDFATPANTTGTVQDVAVPLYNNICPNASRGACIPQPGTTNKLESLNFHLMHRLVWRMAAGREELLATATVAVGARSGIRWYESQNPHAASPTFFQAATYAPDNKWRWMPSVAMDKMGNLAIGYSVSDATSTKPSLAIAGRLRSELRNVLEPEVVVFNGPGSQTGTLHRWGDYSSMHIDPADDCTFFFTTEFLPANGTFNWNTRIVSFKFPNCH